MSLNNVDTIVLIFCLWPCTKLQLLETAYGENQFELYIAKTPVFECLRSWVKISLHCYLHDNLNLFFLVEQSLLLGCLVLQVSVFYALPTLLWLCNLTVLRWWLAKIHSCGAIFTKIFCIRHSQMLLYFQVLFSRLFAPFRCKTRNSNLK